MRTPFQKQRSVTDQGRRGCYRFFARLFARCAIGFAGALPCKRLSAPARIRASRLSTDAAVAFTAFLATFPPKVFSGDAVRVTRNAFQLGLIRHGLCPLVRNDTLDDRRAPSVAALLGRQCCSGIWRGWANQDAAQQFMLLGAETWPRDGVFGCLARWQPLHLEQSADSVREPSRVQHARLCRTAVSTVHLDLARQVRPIRDHCHDAVARGRRSECASYRRSPLALAWLLPFPSGPGAFAALMTRK